MSVWSPANFLPVELGVHVIDGVVLFGVKDVFFIDGDVVFGLEQKMRGVLEADVVGFSL